LAKVDKYKLFNNKLIKLSIVIDSFADGNDNYDIIREYDLTKDDIYVPIYARNQLTNQNISLAKFKKNFDYLNENKSDFIP